MNEGMLLIVGLIVIVAGCGYVPTGGEVNIGFDGSINVTSAGFRMNGDLTSGGGIPDLEVYHNVTVKLYSEERELIRSEELGELEADAGRLPVSITADRIPQYVIFASPDFWKGDMQVEYYVRQDSNYAIEYATSRSDIPVGNLRSPDDE